jgi:hypothetical protein
MIGAKPAVINTFVGWFYMKIVVVEYLVSIISSSYKRSKYAK